MNKKIFLITISFLILCAIKDQSLFILAQTDVNNKEKGLAPVNYTGAQYRDPLELPIELRAPIKPGAEIVLEKGKEIKEIEEEKEIVLPTFVIQGMVWGGVKPQALINEGLCEKGDIIKGAEITDINKEGVTFIYKNKKFIIQPTVKLDKIGQIKEEGGIKNGQQKERPYER